MVEQYSLAGKTQVRQRLTDCPARLLRLWAQIGAAFGINGEKGMKKLTQGSLVLLVLLSLLFGSRVEALTASEYRALHLTWKLGYVVGIAHGRKLYCDSDAPSRKIVLDVCIPKLSDVEIVDSVDAFIADDPAAGDRLAAEAVIEALMRRCMK